MMTSALSAHIMFVFVVATRNTLQYEIWYYIVGVLFPLMTTAIPFFLGKFGDSPDGCAFLPIKGAIDRGSYWLYFYSYITISILISVIAIISYAITMIFMDKPSNSTSSRTKFKRRRVLVMRVMRRIIW
jgi:heme/copper-type cytochrome/quinol oxidase subunit 2